MISKERPEGFEPNFEVAGCYCEHEGKTLFLQRHSLKGYGNLWGIPAGKREPDEKPIQTAAREILEETGISLLTNEMRTIGLYFVEYPEYKFIFHTFHAHVPDNKVNIKQDELQSFAWLTPEEALELDLVPDEDFCIADFIISKP